MAQTAETRPVRESSGGIRAEGLTKRFGDLTAVDSLDLYVKAGELFCFLGPNGAGKTTTIRMLIGTLVPTKGRVLLDGIDVYKEPVRAKQIIGYVPDEPNVYEKLTALEFLSFIADIYRLDKARAKKRALELLDMFELSDRADQQMGGFSHGMKQKMVLAAALLHEPRILFLDEPTVGLDPKSARMFKDILRGLCDRGITVFMSTHILEIAERMADRVGIIQKGKLRAVGSVDELRTLARKSDEKLNGTQMTLEDLFLELTGGSEYEEVSRYLEG
jgi:ABC-2 type transport system ATP-binding protein